ncbi:MAG: PAS domain S-box protein [Vulcanimicrobiota bacterium]
MSAHQKSHRPIKLLIVDDDRDALILGERVFKEKDFHVISASSGEECLELAFLHRPDIILLDVVLPDFNGVELCRKIKDDPELSSIFVILISYVLTDNDTRIGALESGADEYIVRPISNRDLLARVWALARIKKAEEAIREGELKFGTLVELMNEGFFIVDCSGIISYANRKLCDLWGYTPSELINLHLSAHLDEQNSVILAKELKKRKKGEAEPYELKLRRKDGETVSCIVSPQLIFDDESVHQGSYAVITDITELKQKDRLISATNRILELYVSNPTRLHYLHEVVKLISRWTSCRFVGIRILTEQGGISFQSFTGFPKEFWRDENFLVLDKDECICMRTMLSALRPGEKEFATPFGSFVCNDLEQFFGSVNEKETQFYRKKCLLHRFSSFAIIPLRHKGKVIGIMHIAEHEKERLSHTMLEFIEHIAPVISETIHHFTLEKSLRESEEKYRLFMNNAADPIVITDEAGLIVEANKKAIEFFGYSHNELLSRSVEILLPSESDSFVASMMRKLREIRSQRLTDIAVRRKDGTTASTDITASLFEYKGAWILQVLFRDMTTQKVLEHQFVQAQKMEGLGRLVGGIAHDFNNFLTAIDGFSTMVRDSFTASDPRREDINDILSASSSAATLARQLLTFSRKKPMDSVIVDLNELILNTDRMLRRIIGEDIELIIIPSQEPACVKADPGAIEQVLVNLSVNARDAMVGGGRLLLETSIVTFTEPSLRHKAAFEPGDYVVLNVSDTGTGMTDEMKSHIFEPFFTTKEEGKGTGLGLSTVYGIIEQHQGVIEVTSKVGKGTAFRIYLHRHEKAEDTINMDNKNLSLIGGSETILVVDDDPSIRRFMTNLLKKLGYSVLEAGNGEEALVTIASSDKIIHLVITDIVMPLMGGKTLMEQIYLLGIDVAVLFVSGYACDMEDYKSILHRVDFLEKPFTAIQFATKIRQCLDRKTTGTGKDITQNVKIAVKSP